MSDSSKAVFLSYASQDAEAARRICDALPPSPSLRRTSCAAGVEVWFDQSELTGGDAWGAKIRKQIKECALFAVEAWTEKAWLLWGRGRLAEAQALSDRALARER